MIALQHAMNDAVDEVLRVTTAEGIDIDAVKGGELNVATNQAQAERLRDEVAEAHEWGETDYELLEGAAARERINVDGLVVGAWTPALRPDPAGQAGRRAGRGRPRPRRRGLRVDAGDPDRAGGERRRGRLAP